MNFANAVTPGRLAALAAVLLAIPSMDAAPAEASVSAGVSLNTLKITGDGLSDKVALRLRTGDSSMLDIDFGDDGHFEGGFPRSTFNQIAVDMGGGIDSVRIDDSAGAFTDTESTEIFGGDGNDTLSGGDGTELLSGGGGDDMIAGSGGFDFLRGGPGDDTFAWDILDEDDTIGGDEGNDRLLVDGSVSAERFVIDRFPAPFEGDVRISREGAARDAGPAVVRVGNVENLDLDALGGNDTILASPDVGELISLDIDAGGGGLPESTEGGSTTESLNDDDVVTGSDAADVISGGPGSDRLEGGAGGDTLNGGTADDTLTGGSGADAMTGGAGADTFGCEAPGEVLDPQPEDLIPSLCIPPAPPAGAPDAPDPAPTTETAASSSLPAGFLGFAGPAVRATRTGLRVTVTNVHTAPITVKLAASERFRTARGARTARYRQLKRTIPAGTRVSLRLRAPLALRTKIAAELRRVGRIVRRPRLTVTNTATGGKRTVRPRLILKRR